MIKHYILVIGGISYMSKLITAVVPVRAGSQRVKNKSIKPFADTTLLDLKLKSLSKIKTLDRIIVSTDSPQAKVIAEKYNVEIHDRDPYFASSECTNSEFFENIATFVECGHILYAPVTAPMILESTYYDFINRYSFCTSNNLVTTGLIKKHLWLGTEPLNYDIKSSPNSQDLPNIMEINYGLGLISKELLEESKNIVSSNPTFYLLEEDEGVDIDTPLDFEFAEFLYKRKNNIK